MNHEERFEDAITEELASYQEQLERGEPRADCSPPAAALQSLPLDLQRELEKNKRCLDLLHALRLPRTNDDGDRAGWIDAFASNGPKNGRFQRLSELGSGGFGVVWRARDPVTGRIVALKLPRPEVLASPELRKRFEQEAEAAARLDHPNIVPILEAGADGIVPYIASAYYEGPTLAQWLSERKEPVPPRLAAQLALALAKALTHAHERGVLHRDVKPSNVLLAPLSVGDAREFPFEPKLMDFGLAKLGERDQELTRTGAMLGTLKYMAPEQAAGRAKEITAATDVYGLGVVLYEMLAGKPPFSAESDWLTLRQVLEDEPRSVSAIRRDVPRDLAVIVAKCLSKSPVHRYCNARELAEDLQRFLDGRSIVARPVPLVERLAKWCRRNPAWAALFGVVTVGLISGLAFLSYSNLRISKALASEQAIGERLGVALESEKAIREQLSLRLYASDLRRAEEAVDRNNITLARQILETYCTPDGNEDYREFAWRYLWKRIPLQQMFVEQLPAALYSLRISPDGRWLATGGADGYVRVWEMATKNEVFALQCDDTEINQVEFSPDSQLLAAACQDSQVRVWETGNWRLRHELPIGGVVTADYAGNQNQFNAVYVQDNGMIVAAGHGLRFGNRDGMIFRFKPNGQRDNSFAKTGDMPCLRTMGHDSAAALLVEENGKIVVAGFQDEDNFVVQRYEPDGSLDRQFGTDGTAVVDLGTAADTPKAMARTGDQKYLLAGTASPNGGDSIALVCLSNDGRLDPTFGKDGIQMTRIGNASEGASAILVQPDSKIVVVGTRRSQEPEAMLVYRFHPNGILDESFGERGCVLVKIGNGSVAQAVGMQCGAQIIVAGQARFDGATRMLAVRLNPDGTRDPCFGCDGTFIVSADLLDSITNSLQVQTDGKIILAGAAGPEDQRLSVVARLTPDGLLDKSFGESGLVVKRIGNGSEFHSVSVTKDNKIVLGGCARCGGLNSNDDNFAVARLLPDGTFDKSFTTNGAQGVIFTPDSSRLISYSHQCIRMWDMRHGEIEQETYCPHETLCDVKLTSDGTQLLTATDKHFWNWDIQDLRVPLSAKHYWPGVIALSPLASRDEMLVSLSHGVLAAWSFTKTAEVASIELHRGRTRTLVTSHDHKLLAAVGGNAVIIYRTSDWTQVAELVNHERIYDVAFLGDSQSLLGCCADGAVLQWHFNSEGKTASGLGDAGSLLHRAKGAIEVVGLSADEQYIACGYEDGNVVVLLCASGEIVYSNQGEGSRVRGLGFPRPNQLLVGYASGNLVAIDLEGATATYALALGHPIGHLSVSPNGQHFAVSQDDVRTIEIRAWPDANVVSRCEYSDELADLKFSSDGKRLIICGAARLEAFDVADGQRVGGEFRPGYSYQSLHMLNDPTHALVAEKNNGIAMREIPSGRVVRQSLSDKEAWYVAATSDERNIAISDSQGAIEIWDARTWEKVVGIDGHQGPVKHLSFSKDGRRLFASIGGDLYVWEAP